MNDLNGPTGGGSAEPRFPTIAPPEQNEPDMTRLDWFIAVLKVATLLFAAGVAVFVAAMILGAVVALVF